MRGGDRRRTPGLRREEVAVLAGVSIDYYTRLEQGKERHPSEEVLGALARALHLDPEATEHLYELGRPRACKRTPAGLVDRVSPHVLRLVENWDHAPAFVVNRWLDVLAQNRLGAALHDGLEHNDNLIRMTFLDPAAREFYLDWEQEAWSKVAHLRAAAGPDHDDLSLLKLVEELSLGSGDFRRLWARHDVQAKTHTAIRHHHRDVGDLTLWHETLRIDSAPCLRVFVGQAEPGSPSEEALAKLACSSLVTDD
jgi:transcriptional regulator with XRE-family HTH domain